MPPPTPRDLVSPRILNPPKENIFLFVPNLIGYTRILLAITSLYYMPLHPRRCTLIYSLSCILDAADGYLARRYNQSTKFGAVLDMVTDRCTTTCLLVFLSMAMPRWSMVFQLLISLDFTSHYMHMYATLAMGGGGQSHKNVDKGRSRVMHLYYTNKVVLFVCCSMNELFFIALYLLSFSSSPGSDALETTQVSDLLSNEWSAGAMELARANKMDDVIPWRLAVIAAPFMAFKQLVNVIQIVNASQWLAEGDRAERMEQRVQAKKLR